MKIAIDRKIECFEDAVAYARDELKPYVTAEGLDFLDQGPMRQVYWYALGLRYVRGADGEPLCIDASGYAQLFLFVRSFADPEAYDLLDEIAVGMLHTNRPLPRPLRSFILRRMRGKPKRPARPGRNRLKNWDRDFWMTCIIRGITDNSTIRATRNDASPPESACDAVSAAFAELATR